MPEGPEVKRNAVALSKILSGKCINDAQILSGRYTRNELVGFKEFTTAVPCKAIGVGCHGKFIYFMFNNGWNLWSTLGMTGVWSKNETKHSRFCFSVRDSNKIYYNDIRNFGTLKFVYGKKALIDKLNSLGLDLLSQNVSNKQFINLLRKHNSKNICKAMMNQSILAGVGNYVKAEALWIARINPHCAVGDLEDYSLLELKEATECVLKSSYEHGGATFLTHTDFAGYKGKYTDRFLCYNRKIDADGNAVTKIKTPDGRTTHWSKERQGELNV